MRYSEFMPNTAPRLLWPFAAAVLTTLVCAAPPVHAQAQPAPAPALAPTDRLPFDAAVTHNTLPNGLTYYIRKNSRH